MEIGLMSLGDVSRDPITGVLATPAERHLSLIEAAVLADRAGFASVNVGEHHGLDFVFSSPPVMLAAIAARTERIRLSTAVTLLANLDPFRAAEDYATLDVISGGRAELVAGRGNFFGSTYTLFGQDVARSRQMFDEAVELFVELWRGQPVHWSGTFRANINGERLQPTPVTTGRVPLGIGGGSSLETCELAARLGLDLVLPSAFGRPASFRPIVDHYLEHFDAAGHDHAPRIGSCWHINVGTDGAATRARWEPRYHQYYDWTNDVIHKTNAALPLKIKPFDYEWLLTEGPAFAGSPAEVVDRLGTWGEMLSLDYALLSMDMGGMPSAELLEMVALVGDQVIPALADV